MSDLGRREVMRLRRLAGASLAVLALAGAAHAGREFPQPFDVGVRYSDVLHVDASAPPGGDGSAGAPFRAIHSALSKARPGTRVEIAAGQYGPIGTVSELRGTAQAPIGIAGSGSVVIDGAGDGVALRLVDPRYVILEGLTIRNSAPHGINIDDGGTYASPAEHVVLRNITFSQIGDGGNNDCLKMSGVDDFYIENSRFTGCNKGEAIDMVGCHRGVVAANVFADMPGSAVQTKGGSSDVLIHGNRFARIGERAINAGGSTGAPHFRPLNAPHEAERIQAIANIIESSGSAPVVFSGCDSCVFANNTVIDPGDYVARIVEENRSRAPGGNGHFINNIIVFQASGRRSFVDIGPGAMPATYTFASNLWYAEDPSFFVAPAFLNGLPAGSGGFVRQDPLLDRDRRPLAGSPALGAGRPVPGGIARDFDRQEYDSAPAIGAFAKQ